MPTTETARPTGAKSNMEKGSPSARARYCAMTMLGGVPISVIMPPRMVAKESGIRVSAAARFALAAASRSSGIRSASAATLLMTADSAAPTTAMTPIWTGKARSGATTRRAMRSTAPELTRPRETISTSAMMTTAGWPKPSKADSGSIWPATTAISSAAKATRS
jgi:hypothetical protein